MGAHVAGACGNLPAGGGRYFGCRHCYNLTYTSCQESHKYDACLAAVGAPMGLSAREVGKAVEAGDNGNKMIGIGAAC